MTKQFLRIADLFTQALKERQGEHLHAVVLYGSVARGTAHADSDIDLLVVTDDPKRSFEETEEIAYRLDFDSGFTALVMPIEFSPHRLEAVLRGDDPFLDRVLREGKVLYDDGTLARFRRQIPAASA